jgi:hypothetical protein
VEARGSAFHLLTRADGDRDQGCGVAGVRAPDAFLDTCWLGTLAQQERAGTEAPELLRELRGDRQREVDLVGVDAVGVDRDDRAVERQPRSARRLALAHHGAARRVDRRPVPADRVHRVEPDDPVHPGRDVALELPDATVGARPEDPVLLAGVEPEGVQHPLERADVVPAERRRAQVQGAVAEPVAGLDELAPRVRADDPVRWEPPGPLELTHGRLGGVAEGPVELVGRDVQPRPEQPVLYVADVLASRTVSDQVHEPSLRGTEASGNRRRAPAMPRGRAGRSP